MAQRNIMSIDLESWVQGHDFLDLTSGERKEIDNEDTVREAEFILNELSKRSIKLTWYVVAELAEWYPRLIENIRDDGHEIGYHTHDHHIISDKQVLESQLELSGDFLAEYRPVSFQAPAIVFCLDGYGLLKRSGILYSLSVYGNTPEIVRMDGSVAECPVSVGYFRRDDRPIEYPAGMNLRLLAHGIPFGSSFWYAVGYRFISSFIDRYIAKGKFVNMFIHNWQLYPPSGRAKSAKRKFCLRSPGLVMYLPDVSGMFFRLMDNYNWGTAKDVIADHPAGGTG